MSDRRWSAKITLEDDFNGSVYSATFDAQLSASDLQKAQAQSAISEAAQFIRTGQCQHAEVQLYKTTKAGTRRDQCFQLYFDDRTGKVRAQR